MDICCKKNPRVIATGEPHSVEEIIEVACKFSNIPLAWRGEGVQTEGYNALAIAAAPVFRTCITYNV